MHSWSKQLTMQQGQAPWPLAQTTCSCAEATVVAQQCGMLLLLALQVAAATGAAGQHAYDPHQLGMHWLHMFSRVAA